MKVFISADMEGTAGITTWSETERETADYPQFQALMTAEVLAACEGARAAGAREIIIKDAHSSGRNLLLEGLPDDVRIVRNWSGHPHSMMFGLTEDCDAAIYTGYHDAAGTDSNPLAHSFNGRIMRLTINGALASEFTVNATTAASLGVPSVFLSGDAGICAAAADLVPGIVTTPVSEGFGPATRSISPLASRAAIRSGVEQALRDLPARSAAPLSGSWEVEVEYSTPVDAYRGSFYPQVEYVAPRKLTFVRDDWFDVLRALRFL
ncbi:peptide ABC transporter [Paracoccus suum]|uniref:Peptide ABC transporter n=1 Tax=Paracoccus suum TaxID=2259340 RepID=A0A344PKQ8_9RHOB|nr:M55 family metallopeptidase [Paracoccus suum]AXC49963.1 peptide ABC transporter [Paracoccus suum]